MVLQIDKIGDSQQDGKTKEIVNVTQQMETTVTTFTKRDKTTVGIFPGLPAVNIPLVMNVKLSRLSATPATETVATHDLLAPLVPLCMS